MENTLVDGHEFIKICMRNTFLNNLVKKTPAATAECPTFKMTNKVTEWRSLKHLDDVIKQSLKKKA